MIAPHTPSGRATQVSYVLARQAFALGLVVAATIATAALHSVRPQPRALLFYPAVFASAALGGLGAGLTATIASVVAIAWLFVRPYGSLTIATAGDELELAIFFGMGIAIAWTTDRLATERRHATAATDQATRALAVRDEVLAVVAHDLKNPLQTITLSSTLLATGQPSDAHVHAERILRSSERATRLIANLLDAAAMDAGTFHIEPRRYPLRSLVSDAVAGFEPLAAMRNVRLRAAAAPDVSTACVPDRLLEALYNVIANALQYTPSGEEVVVGVDAAGDELRFSVRDSGPGMTPEQAEHAFQRFWQGRRGAGGRGLGLFIAKGIVEAHGGQIAIASEPGRGTTVVLGLPRQRGLEHLEVRRRDEGQRPAIH